MAYEPPIHTTQYGCHAVRLLGFVLRWEYRRLPWPQAPWVRDCILLPHAAIASNWWHRVAALPSCMSSAPHWCWPH